MRNVSGFCIHALPRLSRGMRLGFNALTLTRSGSGRCVSGKLRLKASRRRKLSLTARFGFLV